MASYPSDDNHRPRRKSRADGDDGPDNKSYTEERRMRDRDSVRKSRSRRSRDRGRDSRWRSPSPSSRRTEARSRSGSDRDRDSKRDRRRLRRRSASPRDPEDASPRPESAKDDYGPDRDHDDGRDDGRDRDRDRDRDYDRDYDRGYRKKRRSRRADDNYSDRGMSADDRPPPSSTTNGALARRKGPLPSQGDSFAVSKTGGGGDAEAALVDPRQEPKEQPNFGSTGLLAAASNSIVAADGVTTIVLKYHEPPEARKPAAKHQWRLFVFKGDETLDTIELGTRSCWLVGRELAVVDLPAEHPSVSKQHAVIQFRHVEKRNEYGDRIGKVKPYLIDLQSQNGTLLNNERIPDSRYYELRNADVIRLGESTRDYVLMLAPNA